ncbi:cytochrome P450 [Favolaschia claudopus]|uniref:Cytochrome P450 n=1 Tax=Favolaschia claudopus TaxID=2862362 RepID=A0AAW0E343_9AGAR
MLLDEKTALFAVGAVALAALYFLCLKQDNPPLPPGPRGVPVLGNAADLPRSHAWLKFTEWAKTYGPIVHLRILGKSIIILNDKSRIYSNRPNLVMGGEMVGWDEGPALIQFGPKWTEYRRLMAQFLGTRSKIETAYSDVIEKATHSFLHGLLQSPRKWKEHGYRFAGAIVLKIAYGYEARDHDDPLVKLVDDAMDQFSELTGTNAFAVDTFPLLRYVPQWFPGTEWKKKVGPYRTTLQTMLSAPFAWTKEQMERGSSISCFVSDLLETNEFTSRDEERTIKWAAAGIYSGGAETTAAVVETFFLAMILQPECEHKAQTEIDTVLGYGTIPGLTDPSRLPYTEGLLSEVLRVYSIGPTGLPHVAAENDVHNGYFIPKDSIIVTNNWLFYRDPNTYADPEIFRPERFVETTMHIKEKDPRDILFGYGRRACPGIHLADAALWLLFTSVLAFFDIRAPIKDGRPVFPSGIFSDGSISRPESFACDITPREGASEVIRRVVEG